ncbi:VOC family protein [Sorangium sp. So ce1153]|uniref:VOC family protein n=1 Tax=Sorangium sp. So ce1153 TaxID=3133333 RepID=UPI003F630653
MAEALTLVVLYCSDIDVSLRFYERLGLSFVKEQHGAGPIHYSSQLGDVVLELYPAGRRPGRVRLAVTIPAALHSALQQATGEASHQPERAVVLEDPDRNQVEITRAHGDVRQPAGASTVLTAETATGRPFELWLEFEHWVAPAGDDPTDDFFNMAITLPSGVRYALNVWTYKAVEAARKDAALGGENLSGRYLEPPDLLVERMDRALLEAVVGDLLARNALREAWRVAEEPETG